MDNLPTNNQKTFVSSDQTTTSEPSPQIIPETPPEPEPTSSNEQPIEIGSLGQPSLSTIQYTNNSTQGGKSKKAKTFVSVLGILLIIIALPLSIVLVKQRQEIRKKASESQAAFSDIQITFESETAPSSSNGGTYSTIFKVVNTVSSPRTVVVNKKACHCSTGNPPSCNDNCSSENATLTLGGKQSTNVTISARQPNGTICGSFQTDLTIVSVNIKSKPLI